MYHMPYTLNNIFKSILAKLGIIETVKSNADEFIKHVIGQLPKHDHGMRIYSNEWPMMQNPNWRDYVLYKLPNAKFYPPGCLASDWVFSIFTNNQKNRLKAKLHDVIKLHKGE